MINWAIVANCKGYYVKINNFKKDALGTILVPSKSDFS